MKKNSSKKKLTLSYEEEEEGPSEEKKCINKLDLLKNYETSVSKSKTQVPKDFLKIWKRIEKMREGYLAPVDSMGAEYCSDKTLDRPIYKFQTLVSLLLSSQTKDPITFATMEKLIKHGLTVDNIIATEEDTLKEMLYGVSFHNNKSKFLKKIAQKLKDDFASDPPEDYEEIITLPGIGPKMAHIYLQCCCGKIEGIAVDTHVHRICNRLKWVNQTKTPENTRKELESWLPKDKWSDINLLLVGFGQTVCSAVAPKCQDCSLKTTCEFGIDRLNKLNEKKSKSKSKSKSKEKLNNNIESSSANSKSPEKLNKTFEKKYINENSAQKSIDSEIKSSLKSNARKSTPSKSPSSSSKRRK